MAVFYVLPAVLHHVWHVADLSRVTENLAGRRTAREIELARAEHERAIDRELDQMGHVRVVCGKRKDEYARPKP